MADQGNIIRAPDLPEDGHEWKKYGQKLIRTIGKHRSYFICQRANCKAKKRVEWSPLEPDDLKVVYVGTHTHEGPDQAGPGSISSVDANRYNLLTQVLGDGQWQSPPDHDPTGGQITGQ
ncbi:hypothetical protein SAY87_016165 [Trapa incisa]|uniref:WRKY domain-containing protein n=1 Tax=Trapa incisa TaxID=236973 RepID=A0AAN7L9I8_9MYRT|nr:hypothetical protein SAY87_016165 [Trapa incisa]